MRHNFIISNHTIKFTNIFKFAVQNDLEQIITYPIYFYYVFVILFNFPNGNTESLLQKFEISGLNETII